jgi:formylmethanofuran dehydrogenase subunit E
MTKIQCENCGEKLKKKELCYFKTRIFCERCFYRFKMKGKAERYQEKNKNKK